MTARDRARAWGMGRMVGDWRRAWRGGDARWNCAAARRYQVAREMTQTPHDALFKAVFSRPERAAEELRHVLGPALARAIDLATLRLEPGSVVDELLRERHTDLLFSARCGAATIRVF